MITIIKKTCKLDDQHVFWGKLKRETDYRSKNIFFSDIYKDFYGRIENNSFNITCKRLKYIGLPQYHLLQGYIENQTLHLKAGIHNIVLVAYILPFLLIFLSMKVTGFKIDLQTIFSILIIFIPLITIRYIILKEVIIQTFKLFNLDC